jgi:hypothetical protein
MNVRTIFGGVLFYGTINFWNCSQRAPHRHYAIPIPGTTCSIFPADNVWNTPVDDLPVNRKSAAWAASLPWRSTASRCYPAWSPFHMHQLVLLCYKVRYLPRKKSGCG